MSTIFIAVQCFQCFTMQVKQQKKSSNKWVCVICNEKQSVQRIFARGYLAKDVRKFVQAFNSSRQFESGKPSIPSPTTLQNQQVPIEEFPQSRKRSDWTEYLDTPKEEEGGGGEEGFVLEPEVEIVTEFPKEVFEKRGREGKKQLLKPAFSKRKERPRNPQGDFESEECRRKKAKQVSKWSGYLEEENDGLIEMERAEPPNHYNSWSGSAVSESHYNDQIVEEDIHPDFT
ncbi:hypothetical protein MRB53_029525 [Persea americana]|uniref:Uncharacterized protein n=1 Tax=Persea americana TaxID=3435 RepID=A0ACC2KIN5_PERAE|nr:hypothetical protein MRB53_029525 [Persea americana]|eukprot:TRINITY_DN19315_c0_g1_i1.p1 TRINITY_DN19315_c0_g1~~TRINITY_DN19315_c0_g1_i1.p1  ORF type:complete len:230 (+),score=51.22 TRINITY_DN19315_c0_g1_i1:106-795(+)